MAARGGEWWARGLACLVGIALIVAGVVRAFEDDADGGVVVLLVGPGFILFALGLFLPSMASLEAGPFRVRTREDRERNAIAASAASDAGVIDQIESTDTGPPSPASEDPEVIGTLNYVAGSIALEGVLRWIVERSPVLSSDIEFRLFIFDPERGRLLPVYEPPDDRSEGWEPGRGATGTAWSRRSYVYVEGAAVADATHGLTEAQQRRYSDLAAVAAAPVFNAGGRIVGVLTASSRAEEHGLDTSDGQQDHTLAALLVSRLLVDLFKWFDDTDDDQ